MPLVQSAIEREIARLKLALKTADFRLSVFEKKYNTTSEYFIQEMFAEDLDGGDDEYVQ